MFFLAFLIFGSDCSSSSKVTTESDIDERPRYLSQNPTNTEIYNAFMSYDYSYDRLGLYYKNLLKLDGLSEYFQAILFEKSSYLGRRFNSPYQPRYVREFNVNILNGLFNRHIIPEKCIPCNSILCTQEKISFFLSQHNLKLAYTNQGIPYIHSESLDLEPTQKTMTSYFGQTYKDSINNALIKIDALPSHTQCLKALYDQTNTVMECSSEFSLESLFQSESYSKLKIEKHILAQIICSLISGLSKIDFGKSDSGKEVLKNGMQDMLHYMAYFSESDFNFSWFAVFYEFLCDFLATFLAYTKPYSHDDFQKTAPQNTTRYIASSGMGAVAASFMAIMHGDHNFHVETLPLYSEKHSKESEIYFEIEHIKNLYQPNSPKENESVFLMGFASGHLLCPDKVFENLRKQYLYIQEKVNQSDHVHIIFDKTLCLVNGVNIAEITFFPFNDNPKVSLYFCKSYQKFASLGIKKIKGGYIDVYNVSKDRMLLLQKWSEECFSGSDEFQLMTHMIKYTDHYEPLWIQHAISNWKTIFPKNHPNFKVNGPFLLTTEEKFPKIMSGSGYGYTETSACKTPLGLRITGGVEPIAYLISKLSENLDEDILQNVSPDTFLDAITRYRGSKTVHVKKLLENYTIPPSQYQKIINYCMKKPAGIKEFMKYLIHNHPHLISVGEVHQIAMENKFKQDFEDELIASITTSQ